MKNTLQEIPLNLELADLLVKLCDEFLISFILLVTIIAEDAGGVVQQFLFPFVDLTWM